MNTSRGEAMTTDAERTCTCHPSDNPPRPCPQKFAYRECIEAAAREDEKAKVVEFLWRQVGGDNGVGNIGWYAQAISRNEHRAEAGEKPEVEMKDKFAPYYTPSGPLLKLRAKEESEIRWPPRSTQPHDGNTWRDGFVAGAEWAEIELHRRRKAAT